MIDITRESDLYTVSWRRFSDHHKTMRLNGGSAHMDDMGKLNGTVHHCWFDGSDTRNPRAGFGMIHVLNNLYNNNGYCIGLHSYCKVVAERNYFRDTSDCIHQMYTSDTSDPEYGSAISIDNIFDNTSGDDSDGVGFTVNDYYQLCGFLWNYHEPRSGRHNERYLFRRRSAPVRHPILLSRRPGHRERYGPGQALDV